MVKGVDWTGSNINARDDYRPYRVIRPFLITVELDLNDENMLVPPYTLGSCAKEVIRSFFSSVREGLPYRSNHSFIVRTEAVGTTEDADGDEEEA